MKHYNPGLVLSDEDIKNSNYKLVLKLGFHNKKNAETIVKELMNEGETVIYLEDKKCYAIVKEC